MAHLTDPTAQLVQFKRGEHKIEFEQAVDGSIMRTLDVPLGIWNGAVEGNLAVVVASSSVAFVDVAAGRVTQHMTDGFEDDEPLGAGISHSMQLVAIGTVNGWWWF